MKSILFLAFLLVASFGFTIDNIATDDDRVKIDFYYESLCPYCQQFIERSLKVAASTKVLFEWIQDFWKICNFNLYPYGNAKRVQNGSSWNFTCQHGDAECQGNLIEACAIKKYDLYTQALPFIICLESNPNNWDANGKKCAQTYNLDWNAISQCSKSQEGVKYIVEMAENTEALVPKHTYVPWVVVNDQHTQSTESAVTSNMVRYVCSVYRGSVKIDACNWFLSICFCLSFENGFSWFCCENGFSVKKQDYVIYVHHKTTQGRFNIKFLG